MKPFVSILWKGVGDCQQTSNKMLKVWEGENMKNTIVQCKVAWGEVWQKVLYILAWYYRLHQVLIRVHYTDY